MHVSNFGNGSENDYAPLDMLNTWENSPAALPISPGYYNTYERQQDWKYRQQSHDMWRKGSQNFTQVTTAACQQRIAGHEALDMNFLDSDLAGQVRDMAKSPDCDERYHQNLPRNSIPTPPFQDRVEALNATDQVRCLPKMEWETCTASRMYPAPSDWFTNRGTVHKCSLTNGENFLEDQDCFSPYPVLDGNSSGTPAETAINSRQTGFITSGPSSLVPADIDAGDLQLVATVPLASDTAKVHQGRVQEQVQGHVPYKRHLRQLEGLQEPAQGNWMLSKSSKLSKYCNGERFPNNAETVCASVAPLSLNTKQDLDLDLFSSSWNNTCNFDFLTVADDYAPHILDAETWNETEHIRFLEKPVLPSAFEIDLESALEIPSEGIPRNHPFNDMFCEQVDPLQGSVLTCSPSSASNEFLDGLSPFENQTLQSQLLPTNPGYDRTSLRSKSKDKMLVDLKSRGYSYKDIKIMGQFEEAESTLRGRYRTLTKPKEARVRKPEWGDRDISLLLEGVAAYTNSSHRHPRLTTRSISTMGRRADKIPWKQVAEYMALRGCYKFGNATVKKKWTEIMESHQDADEQRVNTG